MSEINDDRRRFSRVEFEADVKISQAGESFTAQLLDISVNGVLVSTPDTYHVRTDIPVTLCVHLASDAQILMQAALVHSSNKVLGFHCTSIDIDSMMHLRRLIEINLDDPSASERVLNELLQRHGEPRQ